ncbi:hypothetical protein [Apibacter adventoris]|uniref:Uncharacterized protein n=1 Tax=Apibacter adventoris TaxID=1679466 RepID=A0A2S8A889_9FLAO|nr:hypothetical protein [Apibacter adventoris]PQL90773.1 hypothetical protein C4S77_09970 [Apibacter adventoris]
MKLPKFLIADNSDFPDDLYVVHTEFPRFILNVEEEEVEWFDELEGEEEEITNEVNHLIQQAFDFCDDEIDKYEEEEE